MKISKISIFKKMGNKTEFHNSFMVLNQSLGFEKMEFQSFSFGTYDECKDLFIAAFKFCDKTVTDFVWKGKYHDVIQWMADTKGTGLFITGDVGLGKSNIVGKVIPLLFLEKHNKIVHFAHANALGKNKEQLLTKKFLTIDDIGVEAFHNEYGVKSIPLKELVENAERKCNTLFISTNLNKHEMLERYDERTLDRIRRLCTLVKLKGPSLRK
ncbi:MAG: hypothetical protein JEZ14_12285 [Marinilabiliaceae bacterium]|nr:hypothetical protein [Marinilabiliaceae bacterium]